MANGICLEFTPLAGGAATGGTEQQTMSRIGTPGCAIPFQHWRTGGDRHSVCLNHQDRARAVSEEAKNEKSPSAKSRMSG
jgi:hypothetical protein